LISQQHHKDIPNVHNYSAAKNKSTQLSYKAVYKTALKFALYQFSSFSSLSFISRPY